MPDWVQIVESHHAKSHPNDGYRLVTRPSASHYTLDALKRSLGFEFPAEFRSLYLVFDGIGVSHRNEPDETWWLFLPTDQIESFCIDVRKWFRDTHEKYANRFFPFIDFANGDGMGYIVDEAGNPLDGLFCFEHESYRFDESQDVNEFLSHVPVSIEEFLA
jgi:hypothetical protein